MDSNVLESSAGLVLKAGIDFLLDHGQSKSLNTLNFRCDSGDDLLRLIEWPDQVCLCLVIINTL